MIGPDTSLPELLDRITYYPYGMPVRLMERVLVHGAAAIPALRDALVHWQDDNERDLLWIVVLLGQSRDAEAVPPLIQQMRRTEGDILAQAAAEGLANIGTAAVPALLDVARTGGVGERIYAYAALGWIRDDRAYDALVSALGRDRELGDVIALALADQGRPEAIPPLHEAYTKAPPWQRTELEVALRILHGGPAPARPSAGDWRLRYRRLPQLENSIDPDWVGIAAIAHRHEDSPGRRPTPPMLSLQEILAQPAELDEPPERCEDCGALIERPTGVPACPETAVATAVFQLGILNDAQEDEIEDLFELLDEFEADASELSDRSPRAPAARERWRTETSELEIGQRTCRWLIEQGVEHVGPAKALMLAEAGRLAQRYGDPDGLLRPFRPVEQRGPKVGRNDPCPCGSGRKYKHCCLGKS